MLHLRHQIKLEAQAVAESISVELSNLVVVISDVADLGSDLRMPLVDNEHVDDVNEKVEQKQELSSDVSGRPPSASVIELVDISVQPILLAKTSVPSTPFISLESDDPLIQQIDKLFRKIAFYLMVLSDKVLLVF